MRLYGWPVSPYTEKTRAWLRHKELEVEEIAPSLWTLRRRIAPAVGRFVMPTVSDGARWLQDSRHILDTLEAEHPDPVTEPSSPRQRIASALLEVFGDEWLITAALHYRWNLPENARFAIDEFARWGLPGVPRVLARPIARRLARRMSGYLPRLGIDRETIPGIEAMAERTIARLEEALADRPFVLGDRPCMGEFAMMGSLWAHLHRDPASRPLFRDAPAVRAWMHRLRVPDGPVGDYDPSDATPDALLRFVLGEQWPHVVDVLEATAAWCAAHPTGRMPRALDPIPYRIGGHTGRRKAITFVAWKAMRVLDRVDAHRDAPGMLPWLHAIGGEDLLAAPRIPAARFAGHKTVPQG